ncbi:hypothetical protein [Shimia aestuarii]|nr:hypothetical protein [Shimia aestuarii]
MRTFHMQTAAQGVQYYQAQGEVFQPGDPVVTLVDGSPNRKVTNVRLGGNITYVQGPGVQAIIEAVQAAYLMLTEQARYFRETGQYIGGFVVLINGDTEVQPSELDRYADRIDIVQIINVRPYSGKIERIHEPFYTVWKALRQFKYTERASIRLTIGANPEHQREKGGNIAMPILTFAPLGRSPSRGPNRRNFYG